MNKKLKNLPIGISDYVKIRQKDYLYIDKTELIYNLINTGEYYFLSRPRRFGKSLLISTFYNIFRGKKELFKDLYIYDSDYKWEEYPVVRLDFNVISNDNAKILTEALKKKIDEIGESEGLEIKEDNLLKEKFEELIKKLHKKHNKGVVFLVDEYDKPIIDHIGMGDKELRISEENRRILKSFYGVLKTADGNGWARFVFITGITKFSKVSIFSELNNLTDLTMDKRYCDILGITEYEIERDLTPYIQRFCDEENLDCKELREKLRDYYNGYRFSSKDVRVYNPFSLFSALEKRSIENYWFETGTPTFLINLIKEKNIYIPEYENLQVSEALFSTYELSNLNPLPLMFQSGYLTIRGYEEDVRLYNLGFPNKEVKTAFTENLLYEYAEIRDSSKFRLIQRAIKNKDVEWMIDIMKSIYSEIPYTLMRSDRIDESCFHMLFYLMVSASGAGITSEILTSKGRIDALIETRDRYYIIEFKCNQDSNIAIEQIKQKRYYEPYKNKGKEIVLIGINFSSKQRNIVDYKIEKL